MRNYFKVVVALGVLYVCALVAAAVLTAGSFHGTSVKDADILELNDIVKTAEKNWDSLETLNEKHYEVEFVISDMAGNVLYASEQGQDALRGLSVATAVKNRYPYAYVISGGKMRGNVILLDDGMREYHAWRARLMAGFGVGGFALLLGVCLFGAYINKNIILPFRKMERFAGKVAEGKLDEPLAMEKNNMFGVFSESFDIMREELAKSRKRELALQKKEREMVASLSHDLKTPITGIKLTAELLKAKLTISDEAPTGGRQAETTEFVEKLDNIYKKAEQIDVLVTDLFSSALEELGEFKVNCRDEDSTVLADILHKYDDKGFVKAVPVPKVVLYIDTKRMSQVIGNIISNSYKYAGTEIDVTYTLRQNFLEMRIQDHGPGVPQDEIDLITNKFYRGRDWQNSGEEGSGLGLYIARMLMEKMNGELIAESDGDGLSITLMVPLS